HGRGRRFETSRAYKEKQGKIRPLAIRAARLFCSAGRAYHYAYHLGLTALRRPASAASRSRSLILQWKPRSVRHAVARTSPESSNSSSTRVSEKSLMPAAS